MKAGRPEAAQAIWSWRESAAASEPTRSPARARVRGVLQAAAGVAVGALARWLGAEGLALFIFGVASLIALSALASPIGLYAGIERLFGVLGYSVSRALTYLLMVPLFYLFFLPFGLLLRRGKRDRLKRYFEADAATYWEALEGPRASSGSLERQY